jgi:serine/threonine-protein kinase
MSVPPRNDKPGGERRIHAGTAKPAPGVPRPAVRPQPALEVPAAEATEPAATLHVPAAAEAAEPAATLEMPAVAEAAEPAATLEMPAVAEAAEPAATLEMPAVAEAAEPAATLEMPVAAGATQPEAGPEPRSPEGRLYQAGDIIAQKYCLTRVLGEGGMGAVWLARNVKLEVDVAIKLIRHELGSAEASHQLLQEARAAARIGHRSIVRIFDFGETELDDPFIVMEVLTGESLRDVLGRKGRLPATNVVRTLLPIASALIEAHASGIVHRDLKPENIMLVPDKSGGVLPKLLDFGIAKFHRTDEAPDEGRRGRFVVGTPDYMAPEQAGGHDDVDEAADVWALAVILYEALTGRVPFAGPNYAALTFAIMTEEPTPTPELMAGDAELWAILRDGLAKRDGARPTMRAFGGALAGWAMARGIDSDIAGTSLAAHWLQDPGQSPFSAAPPPVIEDSQTSGDFAIPRPGGMPAAWRAGSGQALTEAPPALGALEQQAARSRAAETVTAQGSAGSRSRGAAWLAVAVAVAVMLTLVVLRKRPAPVPPPLPALATSAAVTPSAAPPGAAPEPALPASSSAPSADPAEASAAPVRASAPGGLSVRPAADRPPRKGGRLPIAKQPNF